MSSELKKPDAKWVPVIGKDELEPGEFRAFELSGRSIAVYHVEGEGFFSTDNICTHAFAYLTDGFFENCVVECPLHAGCFDVRTGKGMRAPITEDLQTYPVRIQNEMIEIELPEMENAS